MGGGSGGGSDLKKPSAPTVTGTGSGMDENVAEKPFLQESAGAISVA